MRNPNYDYTRNYDETTGLPNGWVIAMNGTVVWGQTKAAARSRLLRVMRHNAKLTANQANQEEVNDQS